jgi:hypothetical protein
MCRSESKQGQAPNKRVREITADSNDDFVIDVVYSMENKLGKETEALALVNILYGKVRVKLDTGAEVNVIPFRVYQQLVAGKEISSDAEIKRTTTKLTGYRGAEIPVKGTRVLPCSYQMQEIMTEFYIVETDNRTVLSLETCK